MYNIGNGLLWLGLGVPKAESALTLRVLLSFALGLDELDSAAPALRTSLHYSTALFFLRLLGAFWMKVSVICIIEKVARTCAPLCGGHLRHSTALPGSSSGSWVSFTCRAHSSRAAEYIARGTRPLYLRPIQATDKHSSYVRALHPRRNMRLCFCRTLEPMGRWPGCSSLRALLTLARPASS
ncbi:hypothetical protein K438DRAFT_1769280 [Mycena galopus ATCC 62051]|nr:hypothetical protein K438DRAFT_1769280 [Mycena galopus ATCC 62051]